MAHHIFQLQSERQNIPEAGPIASPSLSVSKKLARYVLPRYPAWNIGKSPSLFPNGSLLMDN
jgi:hypothetical protein